MSRESEPFNQPGSEIVPEPVIGVATLEEEVPAQVKPKRKPAGRRIARPPLHSRETVRLEQNLKPAPEPNEPVLRPATERLFKRLEDVKWVEKETPLVEKTEIPGANPGQEKGSSSTAVGPSSENTPEVETNTTGSTRVERVNPLSRVFTRISGIIDSVKIKIEESIGLDPTGKKLRNIK